MLPTWLSVSVAAGLGAILASFFTVVGERGVRRESLHGRSHCVCGRRLHAWENIPVVGYLAAGGRARCCGAPIPTHYFVAEALSAGFVGAAAAASGIVAGAVALTLSQVLVWNYARQAELARSMSA